MLHADLFTYQMMRCWPTRLSNGAVLIYPKAGTYTERRAGHERLLQHLAPRVRLRCFQDTRPGGLEVGTAGVRSTTLRGGVVCHCCVKGVVVVRRVQAFETAQRPKYTQKGKRKRKQRKTPENSAVSVCVCMCVCVCVCVCLCVCVCVCASKSVSIYGAIQKKVCARARVRFAAIITLLVWVSYTCSSMATRCTKLHWPSLPENDQMGADAAMTPSTALG